MVMLQKLAFIGCIQRKYAMKSFTLWVYYCAIIFRLIFYYIVFLISMYMYTFMIVIIWRGLLRFWNCYFCCMHRIKKGEPGLPLYMFSYGQKIGSSRVLLVKRSEVADHVCAALQVWSAQCGRDISALEVAQSYSFSLRSLISKNPTQPNFFSIADGAIMRGGIGSPGSPYLILWLHARNH